MNEATKWIDENVIIDREEINRWLKKTVNSKSDKYQKLYKSVPITGDYNLLGFSIKSLCRTAEVMYGYEDETNRVYINYLTIALNDAIKAEFNLEVLDVDDYNKLVEYSKAVVEELQSLCAINICYTLVELYKKFV